MSNGYLRNTFLAALSVMATLAANSVVAQGDLSATFPTRSIKLIVPKPPGGPVDTFARSIARVLERTWKQSVIVENRNGASGTIGSLAVKQARPDGYTLLLTDVTSQVTAPMLMQPRPYDGEKDFEPVALLVRNLMVLVVSSNAPFKSLEEMTAYAKSNPGKLNFSTAGTGGFAHLMTELLMSRLGIKMAHIPYSGGAPALTAVLAGEVQLSITDLASAAPFLRSGSLRAVA